MSSAASRASRHAAISCGPYLGWVATWERFRDVVAREMPHVINGLPTDACVGPIEYGDRAPVRQAIANFKEALEHVKVQEAFLTAVAPASTPYDGVNEYYPTEKEYVFSLAEALRQEYLEIYRSGLLVQVDDAVLANMYDHWVQQSPARYLEWAQLRVDALNHALRDIPEDRVRYHVCFGSWHVPHLADAPLEAIVDLIVQVNAGAYSIEAQTCGMNTSGVCGRTESFLGERSSSPE